MAFIWQLKILKVNTNKTEEQLTKNINEETTYINSLSLWKYFLIYVPLLLLMFTITNYLASLFFDYNFDWRSILIQAITFAVFFRIFHKVRREINNQWKNKYN